MDNTVDRSSIDEILRKFDRRKDNEERINTASSALDVATAVGANTPTTLLADIRACITELTEATRECSNVLKLTEKRNEERHVEVLAYLSHVGESMRTSRSMSPQSSYSSVMPSRRKQQEQRTYFYGADELKTKESVIGCVLMQMYKTAFNQTFHSGQTQNDATLMELKDWSSLVSIVSQAKSKVTSTQGKLALIKQSSSEAITACDMMASVESGRMVACTVEQLRRLQSECPTLVQVVEEVRQRIVMCHGLTSIPKARTLASMGFPLINSDNTVNMTKINDREGGSKVVLDTVSLLNVPQKKQYASKVLEEGMRPLVAAKSVSSTKP